MPQQYTPGIDAVIYGPHFRNMPIGERIALVEAILDQSGFSAPFTQFVIMHVLLYIKENKLGATTPT